MIIHQANNINKKYILNVKTNNLQVADKNVMTITAICQGCLIETIVQTKQKIYCFCLGWVFMLFPIKKVVLKPFYSSSIHFCSLIAVFYCNVCEK